MCVEVMMDSGSSISIIMESFTKRSYQNQAAPKGLKLVSAAGTPISVIGQVVAPIQVGNLRVDHNFLVVHSLIAVVILGMDFLQKHGIVLDFTTPVMIRNMNLPPNVPPELQPILETARNTTGKVFAVASIAESTEDLINNCAVPLFNAAAKYNMPQCQDPDLTNIIETHKELFHNIPGKKNVTEHFIPTVGSPAKVPPRTSNIFHATTGYY